MIPYRQPGSGQMDYGKLMQLLQMKQMMDQQQQGQQQPKAPSASGIADLLKSFGGGGAGGAAANSLSGSGASTVGADVLSLGQTMPEIGPTIGNAAAIPETGIMANASSMGAGPIAGIIAATVLGGRSGLNMLKGKQKNWKDASLADNAGRASLGIATGGLSEVANKLFGGHKSTKQRQAGRWNDLAKNGLAPESAFAGGINQDMGVDDNKLASGKLGGRDVWATSGMFDTFGKDWATTGDENKREQIAKQMLDNKLFDTKKGVTYVTDKDKAMGIYNSVLGNKPTSPLQSNAPVVKGPAMLKPGAIGNISDAPQLQGMDEFIKQHGGTAAPYSAAQVAPVRTDSPGFKNGKRISYGGR